MSKNDEEGHLLKMKKLKSLFLMTILKALWSTGKRKLATIIASVVMGGTTAVTHIDKPLSSLKECSAIVNDLGEKIIFDDDKQYEEYVLDPDNKAKIQHCIDEVKK